MAIYELKDAQLDGMPGQGYAYPVKTFRGKEYRGVFFGDDPEAIDAMLERDGAEFSGVVYDTTRERKDTVPVEVVNTLPSGYGHRADFRVVETE